MLIEKIQHEFKSEFYSNSEFMFGCWTPGALKWAPFKSTSKEGTTCF